MLNTKKISKMFFVISILILVFVGLNLTGNAQPERPFRGIFAWPPIIDPSVGLGNAAMNFQVNVYDALVYPDENGNAEPHIAKSWDISEDGLVWTFYLREGIKFHDGSELTAKDVKFSMDRMIALERGQAYLFLDRVTDTKVIDDYTVSFALKVPFGAFLDTLLQFFIINKDLVLENVEPNGEYGELGDYGQKFLNLNEAGSGPYRLKEFNTTAYYVLEQNPDYWIPFDPNCPDEWRALATKTAIVAKTLLPKRELEIYSGGLPEETLEVLDNIEGIDLARQVTGDIMYGMINNKKPPTDDIHVRKAMAWATNYKVICEVLYGGVKQAIGPISSIVPGHDPTVFQYHYNLDKAREEIEKSKYYGELDKYPIAVHANTLLYAQEQICMMYKSDWGKLGLTVEITNTPWQKIVEEMGAFDSSAHLYMISVSPGYSEAGSILESKYTSQSVRSWEQNEWLEDPELDKRIVDAIETIDKDERFQKYSELQHDIVDLCPSLFLFERADKFPYQSYYFDWPMADGDDYNKTGFNLAGRFMRIYPEKRLEILKK